MEGAKEKIDIQIISIDDYANNKLLNSKNLMEINSDVILLPNNKILQKIRENENHFTSITKEILLKFQDKGINAELYDDGKHKHEILLRSAHTDIILPALIFADKYLIPIALGILSTWIYDRWIKTKKESQPIEIEYGYINPAKEIVKTWKIKGEADEVSKVVKNELNSFNRNLTNLKPKIKTESAVTESRADIFEKSAQESMKLARKLIENAKEAVYNDDMGAAESLLRESLGKIREAFLLTENEVYQDKLYTVGRKIHNIFGCHLEFEKGEYKQSCPVILSNSTFGFSIGGSSNSICSICGKNTLECSHVNGLTYDNVLANDLNEFCNICGETDCNHELGTYYDNVEAFTIITEMYPDHISLVKKPADPLCVIMSHSVSKTEILNQLPKTERDKFVYGETLVYCNHCILKK